MWPIIVAGHICVSPSCSLILYTTRDLSWHHASVLILKDIFLFVFSASSRNDRAIQLPGARTPYCGHVSNSSRCYRLLQRRRIKQNQEQNDTVRTYYGHHLMILAASFNLNYPQVTVERVKLIIYLAVTISNVYRKVRFVYKVNDIYLPYSAFNVIILMWLSFIDHKK